MLMTMPEDPERYGAVVARELLFGDVDPTDDEMRVARQATQPERRLFFAILSDAIVRFRKLVAAREAVRRDVLRRVELQELERWFRSDDSWWPCSFTNVCDALDLAAEPLRRALLRGQSVSHRKRVTRRGLLVSVKRSRAKLDAAE
jgi:hypothetical protein